MPSTLTRHDHAADTSTLPSTWERRGGWSEPLRCGRTARTRAGRGRLAEHSGELGALLRRELGLAALDRAHSAHTEVGLQPLDLADLGLDPGEVHGIGAKQLGQIHLGHALVCVQLDRNLLKVAPDLLQLLDLARREAELHPAIEHERDERALGAGISRGEVAAEALTQAVELDGKVIEGAPHLLV